MARRRISPATSASPQAISASSTRARAGFKVVLPPVIDALHFTLPLQGRVSCASSLRQDVLAVLDCEDDARAVVEAVAVFFGVIIDALACRDFPLGQPGLADRFAKFRCAGLGLL